MFSKKNVLKNFLKFTGKHLWQTLAQVFSWEFCKVFKNTFFIKHLWRLILYLCYVIWYFWPIFLHITLIIDFRMVPVRLMFDGLSGVLSTYFLWHIKMVASCQKWKWLLMFFSALEVPHLKGWIATPNTNWRVVSFCLWKFRFWCLNHTLTHCFCKGPLCWFNLIVEVVSFFIAEVLQIMVNVTRVDILSD